MTVNVIEVYYFATKENLDRMSFCCSGFVLRKSYVCVQVRMLAEAWKYTAADRFLHCLPLHHILHNAFFLIYLCSHDVKGG